MSLARKKRRINAEYEAALERASSGREELTILSKRYAWLLYFFIHTHFLAERDCVRARIRINELSVRRQEQADAVNQAEARLLGHLLDQQKNLLAMVSEVPPPKVKVTPRQ